MNFRYILAIHVLILMCTFLTSISFAQDNTIEQELGLAPASSRLEIARTYHQDCMNSHTNYDDHIRDLLCTCTASKIMTHMSDKDITDDMPDIIHNEFYIPCTAHPVHAMTYKDCMDAPSTLPDKKKIKICTCMSSHLGQFSGAIGRFVIGDKRSAYSRKIDKNAPNPLTAFLGSKDYREHSTKLSKQCIQKHTIWQENFR